MNAEGEPLILTSALVWDGASVRKVAIAVAGGRIAAVGTVDEARAAARGAARVDLDGRLVVPGFIESHAHVLSAGEHIGGLDLRGAVCEEEFVARVRRKVQDTPPGEWITGGRWDATRWPGGRGPHRRLIDSFTGENPVLLSRADGHIALANSRALVAAGITRETADPPGGRIGRDADGEPTGILRDAAIGLVAGLVPEGDCAAKARLISAALAEAACQGVTTIVDFAGQPVFDAYRRLEDSGALTCRIRRYPPLSRRAEAAERARETRAGGLLTVPGVKAFVDGSLGARTAWFFEDYADEPGNAGLAMAPVTDGSLERELAAADRAGLQLAVHAIGDRANAVLLDMFERIVAENGPRDRRLRIEHAQHLRAADAPRFGALGVTASVQPLHITLDAPLVEKALGPARRAMTYPFRALIEGGANLAFGTDWPVVPLDTIGTIRAAVTREGLGGALLTVEEAMHAYTSRAAWAVFAEADTGAIAPGMSADLAVLSENIFETAAEAVGQTQVLMTVAQGRMVYGEELA